MYHNIYYIYIYIALKKRHVLWIFLLMYRLETQALWYGFFGSAGTPCPPGPAAGGGALAAPLRPGVPDAFHGGEGHVRRPQAGAGGWIVVLGGGDKYKFCLFRLFLCFLVCVGLSSPISTRSTISVYEIRAGFGSVDVGSPFMMWKINFVFCSFSSPRSEIWAVFRLLMGQPCHDTYVEDDIVGLETSVRNAGPGMVSSQSEPLRYTVHIWYVGARFTAGGESLLAAA